MDGIGRRTPAAQDRAPEREPEWARLRAPSGFRLVAVGIGTAAALFLAWRAAGALFLVFTGLLFAVFLDACARALGRIWRARRGVRLAVASGALLLLAGTALAAGGYTVVRQADDLAATVQTQLFA